MSAEPLDHPGGEPAGDLGEDQGRSSTPVGERSVLVHWFTGRLHEVLEEVVVGPVGTLSATEAAEVLVEIDAAQARLDAVRLRVLGRAEVLDVAGEQAAASTGAWLAGATRAPRGEAFGLVKLARAFERGVGDGFAATRTALAAGRVRLDQARVIVEAVERLPAWVPAELRTRGEEHLLGEAASFDAPALRRLGKHLLGVIDPEGAEAELGRQVAAEEAAASRRVMLSLYDDGKGTCHGVFRISTLHGAMLQTAIEALASPKRPDPIERQVPSAVDEAGEAGEPGVRATSEVHGVAFQELLERYPATRLPKVGGGLATVVVTMDARWLATETGVATLDTTATGGTGRGIGAPVSAGLLRRLACQAGIIPQVLGSASEVLDQGRKVRLFTAGQHLALRTRDKSCTAVGCTIPAAWCHAHHRVPWSKGGATDLTNGRLLCPRHHTMIHHDRYAHTDLPDGRVQITRRRQ